MLRETGLDGVCQGALPWRVEGAHDIVSRRETVAQEAAKNSDIRHPRGAQDRTWNLDVKLFAWDPFVGRGQVRIELRQSSQNVC